jgi:hypothetical protein
MQHRNTKRVLIAGIVACFILAAMPAAADWTGKAPAPTSPTPWLYDFGPGWMTVEIYGHAPGLRIMMTKVASREENRLNDMLKSSFKVSGEKSFTGFLVMQADASGSTFKEISDFSSLKVALVFRLYFTTATKEIVFVPEKGGEMVSVMLSQTPQKVSAGGFDMEITGPQAEGALTTYVIVVNKWPAGDPKMGG